MCGPTPRFSGPRSGFAAPVGSSDFPEQYRLRPATRGGAPSHRESQDPTRDRLKVSSRLGRSQPTTEDVRLTSDSLSSVPRNNGTPTPGTLRSDDTEVD